MASRTSGDSGGGNPTSNWNFYVPFGEASASSPPPNPPLHHQQQHKTEEHAEATLPEARDTIKATPIGSVETDTYKTSFREKWTTFWSLSVPYFRENGEGRCLFAGLIVLMLLDSGVRVGFSYLARDFWSALGDKDIDAFYRIMKQFLMALLFLAPVNVFYRFQRQRLAIKWRKWMTERILRLYFYNSHQVYYHLERRGTVEKDEDVGIVDNPDQRIAEDVRAFTRYSLTLFLTIAVSLIDLVAFSTILYLIEPKLFLSIVGFATLGTIVTVLLGNQLVRLNFERLQKEADFRFSLVRLRENAESIAFFRGEKTEGREISDRFDRVVNNAYSIIGTMRDLEFFTASYNYLTWILPVVVIAPQYMAGNVELGVVQQAAAAFGHVLDDLSLIINQFESLSEFSASIGRLHQFVRAVKNSDPDLDDSAPLLGYPPGYNGHGSGASSVGKDGIFNNANPDTRTSPLSPQESIEKSIQLQELPPSANTMMASTFALAIKNLRLDTPHCQRTLIHSLNLELRWGERLLIIGSSGIGKSSLLRAIAGLWSSGTGTIERANTVDVYFLPQKPYCPLGTLRDQLLYPISTGHSNKLDEDDNDIENWQATKTAVDDQRLLSILKDVDLGDLASRIGQGNELEGLGTTLDWSSTLSLGEQQRLAFARVLVHQPKMVIVDEATSAMDVGAEERMYSLIQSMTVISVGHRPTLLGYHTKRLHLKKTPGKDYCECTVDDILSNPNSVNNEEVNLFFR
ncbi:ABC transporter ATP-binding protein [Nitzschia inconspicua]|uniref:ABC transporter ATP-binding protein n=1 Tax=Nitzschia inconspicua TaxID=303405 RepID=A0A9K3M5A1_9STRA|nr:ABC transporter ATP-binding protein [Nitzschia inconspicua]